MGTAKSFNTFPQNKTTTHIRKEKHEYDSSNKVVPWTVFVYETV